MKASLDVRLARAGALAATFPDAAGVLGFYRDLLNFQKLVFEQARSAAATDARCVLAFYPGLIDLVTRSGPAPLVEFARERLASAEAREKLALEYWEGGNRNGGDPAAVFFAKAMLQPYAEYLASRGDIGTPPESAACPFCGSKPVVAALRPEGDGGKRWLICALCATEWQFRRVLCPSCGEQDQDKLPVYTAAGLDYVRVDACDACRTYIKTVDLTRNGLAVPVVDELATVTLNIWAEEREYVKLETNVLGM